MEELKKCSNCDNIAEHEHHVVPKSKGGTFTVPLCAKCHQTIHDGGLSTNYLTKLALFKKQKEIFVYLVWNYIIEETDIKEICKELERTEKSIKSLLKRLAQIDTNDILDAIDSIIDFSSLELHKREHFESEIEIFKSCYK